LLKRFYFGKEYIDLEGEVLIGDEAECCIINL